MNGITPTFEPNPRYRLPQTRETGRISTASRTRSVFLARRSSSSSGRTPMPLRRAVRPRNRPVIAGGGAVGDEMVSSVTESTLRLRCGCCELVDIESAEWRRSALLRSFPSMKKALAIVLIFGFVLVDFLFFHDLFKPGEIVTFPQYLTGVLSIPVVVISAVFLLRGDSFRSASA